MDRRSFLQGAGALVAAGTAYQATPDGLFLPTDGLLTPTPRNAWVYGSGFVTEWTIAADRDGYFRIDISMECDTLEHLAPMHEVAVARLRTAVYFTEEG